MTASEILPAVLDRVDRDLDASLDRLFSLLRIQSVSTDPAYAPQCRKAAEFVASDLTGLGFEASVRPTEGHPVVVAKSTEKSGNGAGNDKTPRVLFYGHYDVQLVDPLDLRRRRRSNPKSRRLTAGARSSSGAGLATIRVRR